MVNQNGKSVIVRVSTEPQSEPNETSPLSQRGRDNNSDASSASAVTSEQSTRKLIDAEMDHSRAILIRIGIDFLLLCSVIVPILVFFAIGEPYNRGFFCNDESLLHPYQKSTVTHSMLYVFGLVLPVSLIVVIEIIRGKLNMDGDRKLTLFSWNVPTTLQNLYKYLGFFTFGTACCQLTTEIAKYSVGRLRPHFITFCQPIMSDGTDCNNIINLHRYVENFTCSNPAVTDKMLKDMRMSFPSANSSFSFYTMLFCALYIDSRLHWKKSKLLNYCLQLILMLMATFTALTRISDYKHHWSDVLAGCLLGIFFALLTGHWIKRFSKKQTLTDQLPTTKYELNTKNISS